jgi:hypothetical protein
MFEPTDVERKLLAELRMETGLTFRRLGGIPKRDREVAAKVLPWASQVALSELDKNHRHVIYALFGTPYARKYASQLVEWWIEEPDELAYGTLTYIIAQLAHGSLRPKVGDQIQIMPRREFRYNLMASLARDRALRPEIVDHLMAIPGTEKLGFSELDAIAGIKDDRIRKWFEENQTSSDPTVGRVANKLFRKRHPAAKLPYTTRSPNRAYELFSTEADMEQLSCVVGDAAKRLGIEVPSEIVTADSLSIAKVNRWMKYESGAVCFWLRLEDVDIVELVITHR